ncbi:MAG: phenylalanine--tRNA ligase subunit beta [SAR202 cluster bacterium]|nr:phenylalanine--tRNA ligase subunit beta [SAR202 cluster bacterium]
MKVPLSWLREMVEINVSVEELAHRLTMAGLEVGGIERIGGWENCFVGYVESVEKHPNADRLRLCTVTIGNGRQQVVCGAPNVASGQKIAFAKVGARVIDSHTGQPMVLKAAKIRGVVSEGMICSERELGLGEDHDGILVLPKDAPVGAELNSYLGDYTLDLEVTPNRADWLSALGVAYEVAALTGQVVRQPDLQYPEEGQPIRGQASVQILSPDLCPRYAASLIRGVAVGPSPRWLEERLKRAGVRPINNVVDVTNYVMLEYGQPLHAFDFEKILRSRIIVRRAYTGETMTTLDGEKRLLNSNNLVIADDREARALAGVIGGVDSEITANTKDVFLESASFEPNNNRQTAQEFRFRTEATIRFEKGLRPGLVEPALRRATKLIQQVAGGTVARDIMDAYPGREKPKVISVSQTQIKKLLGVEYPLDKVTSVLKSLGFACRQEDGGVWVSAPYWRADVNIWEDVVEEVARITGYDSIPTTPLATPIPAWQPQPNREFRERVRDMLVRAGLQETISYSAVSAALLKKAKAEVGREGLVTLANPMSGDFEIMRPTLRVSIMRTLATNLSYQRGSVAIFELGRVYLPRAEDLPDEREMAAGVVYGPRGQEGWLSPREDFGFYDAKGVVESVLAQVGAAADYQVLEDPFLHPGKSAKVVVGGEAVGVVGEVHPQVREAFDIDGAVAFFELDIEALREALSQGRRGLKALARYPASIRDITVLADKGVASAKMLRIIEGQPLVESAVFYDAYEGKGVPEGKSSLTFRIYFQSAEKTLSSEEVGKALERVVKALEREAGAALRGG